MSTIQERLREAVPDGDLLDEAADEMDRLEAENERLHFDYERLADRKPLDEVDAWRALCDDVFTWIEASQPGGTKAQLNAQFQALDDLIKRYRELRDVDR